MTEVKKNDGFPFNHALDYLTQDRLTGPKIDRNEWDAAVDSPDRLVMLVDRMGRVYHCSQMIVEWGLGEPEKTRGRTIHEVLHPSCWESNCYLAAFWPVEKNWSPINSDSLKPLEDKVLDRFLTIRINPLAHFGESLFDYSSEPFAAVIITDVTRLVHFERHFCKTNEELLSLQEMIQDQNWQLDSSGKVLAFFSTQKDTLLATKIQCGMNISEFLDDTVLATFNNAIQEVLQKKTLQEFEFLMHTPHGIHLFAARLLPLHGDRVNVLSRDITEKKQLEVVAQSVEMINNFGYIFSGIRHEIGNPVNSIKMTVRVLKDNINRYSSEKVLEYINRVLYEINRVEELLRSLKNFNIYEDLQLASLSITDFLNNLLAMVRDDFLRQGITIEPDFPQNPILVLADPRALQQIMLNLLSNAADAMSDCQHDKKIVLGLRRAGCSVELTLRDNGQGMTDSQRENLFRPFFTSKVHGTGLGLVIVKKLLTQMKGFIEVQSVEYQGTTVRFTLPAATDG